MPWHEFNNFVSRSFIAIVCNQISIENVEKTFETAPNIYMIFNFIIYYTLYICYYYLDIDVVNLGKSLEY